MTTCPTCGAQNPPGASTCALCGTALQNPAPAASGFEGVSLRRDTKLRGGNYVIGPVLGQGGFGITYKAGDMSLQRFVAIKEFFPFGAARSGSTVQPTGGMSAASYEETKKKFLEEARILARFSHPAIVRVYGVWEEFNTAYMAMEFLEGKTLQKLIEEKGSIPEKAAVAHIKAVAEALEQVHSTGMIHRDIKPDNICITNDGRTVLIDFGTARAFASGKTVRQTAMLTPGYAPLEQYGQQARFGSFSDVYALGATLYHCLTGRMPAPATDRVSGVESPAPDQVNPAISPGVSRAVMHALQIKAGERPQTMRDFIAELETPAAAPPRAPIPPPPVPGMTQPVYNQNAPSFAPTQNVPPQNVPQQNVPAQMPPQNAPAPNGVNGLGGNYWATRVSDNQILTDAPPQVALSAVWRGFSSWGVNNPTVDFVGGRVLGSTPLDARSYGQNVTGLVSRDARGTLIEVRSESGMPFNLTDFGRSKGEQRGLGEHIEAALRQAPPNGYMPGGMTVGTVGGASYHPATAPPPPQFGTSFSPPPVASPYGPPQPPNPYGAHFGAHLPARRGGEVITYAILSLLGLMCGCGLIFAPIAWIRGNAALAEYGNLDPGDKGTVVAGRMIGIVMTIILCLSVGWLLINGLSN